MDKERDAWIQTYSGKRFHVLDPGVGEVDIVDIAHALSLLCRFGGHCCEFYSVAQHCVLGARTLADPTEALHFLLHDSQEAYLCDLPRPIKQAMPQYEKHEGRVQRVVLQALCVPPPAPGWSPEPTDLRMLATERRDLMASGEGLWTCLEGVEPFKGTIDPWSSLKAELEFLTTYGRLRNRVTGDKARG